MPIARRFVRNRKGQKTTVILDIKEYRRIQKDLEELDSIRAVELAKSLNVAAVHSDQAVAEIERSRKYVIR
jgi:hypothetical protein